LGRNPSEIIVCSDGARLGRFTIWSRWGGLTAAAGLGGDGVFENDGKARTVTGPGFKFDRKSEILLF